MRKAMSMFLVVLLLSGCQVRRDPHTVVIGIIKVPNDTVIAIQNKWIEDAFDALGYHVEFRFFDSGVAMNQAFASGSLDIAEMGYTNSVISAAKQLPVELFWIHDVIGSSEALVVKDHSITSASELRGKEIATVFGSTSHFSLLKVLEDEGLTHQDVTLLNMSTAEIVAAWDRGDLDVSYTWEPTLSRVKESGKVIVDSEALGNKGYMTTNVGLVHKTFAKEHGDLLQLFIKAMDQSYQRKENDFDQVVRDAVDYLKIDTATAKTQIEGARWLSLEEQISPQYMGNDFLQVFLDTSIFWHQLGFIDEPLNMEAVKAFVNPTYIQEVLNHDSN